MKVRFYGMPLEENIGMYLRAKGISLKTLSNSTNLNYACLYHSFYDSKSKRELRGTELLKVCRFLEKDPYEFLDNEE